MSNITTKRSFNVNFFESLVLMHFRPRHISGPCPLVKPGESTQTLRHWQELLLENCFSFLPAVDWHSLDDETRLAIRNVIFSQILKDGIQAREKPS